MRLGSNLVLAVAGLAAVAACLAFFCRSRPAARPAEVVIARKLADGSSCIVRTRPADARGGVPGRLTHASVSARGREVVIPAEALADLRDVRVPEGIQVAEFADELYLLLSGGEGAAAWQAKLTIRGSRVESRELTRGGITAEMVFFAAPTVAVAAANLPLATETGGTLQLSEAQPIRSGGGSP